MQTEVHPLESFFTEVVRETYQSKLRLHDPAITSYVAHMLCDFSEPGNLFRLRNAEGEPIEDLKEMLRAADPVNGTASSFDTERAVRKYIGDYALFVAGMCHDVLDPQADSRTDGPKLHELIQIGKESYSIVSQFNLFEYEEEAPLFGRLAEAFEHCILGLALIREELGDRLAQPAHRN